MRMLPIDVVVPISSMLTLSLPASGRTEKSHKPFSEGITIAGIKDEVGIMASLQKPKKVNSSQACSTAKLEFSTETMGSCNHNLKFVPAVP